jgi:hypothetical protein
VPLATTAISRPNHGNLLAKTGMESMGRPHALEINGRPAAYRNQLSDRIKAGKAVKVLNRVLGGEVLPTQQVNVAMFVINKLVPSMQAIAVQVEHKVAASREDLIARALARGIDPDMLFRNHQAIPSITGEKTDSPAD